MVYTLGSLSDPVGGSATHVLSSQFTYKTMITSTAYSTERENYIPTLFSYEIVASIAFKFFS
jgi:hypothetical protein